MDLTTMMMETNPPDPRQRLSQLHIHRDPRQRLSRQHTDRDPREHQRLRHPNHYLPPQNIVPIGGAAQITTYRK